MAFKKVTKNLGEDARLNTVEPIRDKKDIKRIREFFDSKGWHKYNVIFYFGVRSGLRISDILGFKIKDVRDKKYVELREQKTGKGKRFELAQELQDLLNDWCGNKPDDAWLFEGRKNKKLDRSQVYRRINDAIEALHIDANVGTHTLRKTFGYHHFRQFNNITLLQQIFNHTSPEVTKRYIGITQDEINTTYRNLNLDSETDQLTDLPKLGASRNRARAAAAFCHNYLKYAGENGVHAPFAKIMLEIINNPLWDKLIEEKHNKIPNL